MHPRVRCAVILVRQFATLDTVTLAALFARMGRPPLVAMAQHARHAADSRTTALTPPALTQVRIACIWSIPPSTL
jgi:hypothetical protein